MLICCLRSCVYFECTQLHACLFFPFGVVFVLCFISLLKRPFSCIWVLAFISPVDSWQNGSSNLRTQQRKCLCHPPPATISSPLYKRILQFEALSSCRQQGNDVRKFAVEFSGAAEGLGYNEAALKDLFNSAFDEPLSWWKMRGHDHLMFGEFVEFLACSPAMVDGVPQVVGDEAVEPPVVADGATVSLPVADKAAAHPGIPGLVRKQEDSPMRSVRAAGIPRLASPKAAVPAPVPAPEPDPFREPTESAPEPAPFPGAHRARSFPGSPQSPLHSREPTEPTPFREPTESAPEPVPWAHGVHSRAHSVPWAHGVRSRARSVSPRSSLQSPLLSREPTEPAPFPGAHRARSVPGAHRVHSWNRSSQVVVVCSTLVPSYSAGPTLVSCFACPALAPLSAYSSGTSSTPRVWPTPFLDIFLF